MPLKANWPVDNFVAVLRGQFVDFPNSLFRCVISSALALSLVVFPEMLPAQQTTDPHGAQAPVSPDVPGTSAVPVSAGPSQERTEAANPAQVGTATLPENPAPAQTPGSSLTTQQPRPSQPPLGTAAAEVGTASGSAASKPAGIAIAPAKQRQSRSFLIKLGALVGAGVAVGAVLALSSSSPGRPPGAP